MNIKSVLFIMVLIAVGTSFFLLRKKAGASSSDSELVVGIAAAYAPFISINPKGEYEGFDIDLAHAIANRLQKKLILKDLGSMTPLFTALDQGTIDCSMWGLSITRDRLKKVAMVHYQGALTSSYNLIFWKEIPQEVRTLADMKGKTVCVEPGSSQDVVLSKYPLIIRFPTEKVDDALLNIQYGKANAALVEPAIAKKFKNKCSEIQMLNIPLEADEQVQGVGIAVKKTNSKMISQLQKAVKELKDQGVIADLERKWDVA